MGLEARGWSLAFANDIDPEKLAMYDAHFGDAAEHFDLDVDTYPCQRTGKPGSGRAGFGYWAALTS